MKLLDCTLRDGGYVNNWNFDNDFIRDYVLGTSISEIDIIELGYKGPVLENKCSTSVPGVLKSCSDIELRKILADTFYVYYYSEKLGFMIDLKDFIKDNILSHTLLDMYVEHKSLFTWCRIAIKYDQIKFLDEVIEIISSKNYKIIVSLMMVSTVAEADINNFIAKYTKNNKIDILYFADSFGAWGPVDIKKLCMAITYHKYNRDFQFGLHLHNNMGLALANALVAEDFGISYMDCSINGMGRGAGNLETEKIMAYKWYDINWVESLSNQYLKRYSEMFGPDMDYFISGRKNIHQKYVFEMKKLNMGSDLIRNKLLSLSDTDKIIYNKSKVQNSDKVKIIIPARYESSRFPGKPLAKIAGKEMIIHVVEAATKALGSCDCVYVATDSPLIANLIQHKGFNAILTGYFETGTDRVANVAVDICKDDDIIINIQGDEPLISPELIKDVIEFKKKNMESVVNCFAKCINVVEFCSLNTIKMIIDENCKLIYASRAVIPANKSGNPCKDYSYNKQVCIYAYNKKQLMNFCSIERSRLECIEDIEILRFIEIGENIKMMEVSEDTHSVDVPSDISIIEDILKEREKC